jgi:hypothetical protein
VTSYKLNKPAAESLAQAHQSEITEGELGNVNSTEHGMGFGSAQSECVKQSETTLLRI